MDSVVPPFTQVMVNERNVFALGADGRVWFCPAYGDIANHTWQKVANPQKKN
jgi:hypothetical protein